MDLEYNKISQSLLSHCKEILDKRNLGMKELIQLYFQYGKLKVKEFF